MPITRINPTDVYPPYENIYSQVILATGGVHVHIAGTIPLDINRNVIAEGNMGLQVRAVYENLGRSLAAVGATPADVVRINIFTLDVDRYLAEGTPEARAFFDTKVPTATLCGVVRLADPRYLVEIEADAILPGDTPGGHGGGHGGGPGGHGGGPGGHGGGPGGHGGGHGRS